ncbi:MAG: hypothetical protein JO112_18690 [Planctomycetes bacterium]|nr:hypothetical protein [Planctomycetota bacterium]
MASTTPRSSAPRAQPARARLGIRLPSQPDDDARRRRRFLLVAIGLSIIIHGVVLPIFFLFRFAGAEQAPPQEAAVVETRIENEKPAPNLENDAVGINPDLNDTNYNLDRDKEPVAIPGVVHKDEPIGIPGGTDLTPKDVPPPPGFGGNTGTGAGVVGNTPGTAPMIGTPGGMGGPLMVPGGIGGRSGATKEKLLAEGGGNTRSEAAVASGLIWLHCHQAPDGHWSNDHFNRFTIHELTYAEKQALKARTDLSPEQKSAEFSSEYVACSCEGAGQNNDAAATGFGLLPFLGAGYTHLGAKRAETRRGKDFSAGVERGLKFLILKQNAAGGFGEPMYSQGIATITLCEAYGLTSDPMLKGPAQRAVGYIIRGQNTDGGWRYSPNQGPSDTSVTGWQVMALKSAQMAGLQVPQTTLEGVTHYLDSASSPEGDKYGYQGPSATPTMTAVGLLCRMYNNHWGPRSAALIKGVDYLRQTPPDGPGAVQNIYYYYYATQVFHHFGGEAWDFWNPKMRDRLINSQDQGNDPKHTHQKGSWSPNADAWGSQGGRMMMTSLSILTLEVYYRYLPLYRREMGGDKGV